MRSLFANLILLLISFSASAIQYPNGGHHVQNVLDSHSDSESSASTSDEYGNTDPFFYNDAITDHFSKNVISKPSKWNQRFYYQDQFWGGDGYPVFLYIGGEGPQGPASEKLFMWQLAKEHKALMVSLEHRFYGESYPTSDMSAENLAYLTSEQALADLARFIEYISSLSVASSRTELGKSTPPLKVKASAADSKWVSFGGSYPGNLATWLKLKYPSSVAGTVGSSAPVQADYNFYRYAEVVGAALKYPLIGGSDQCYDVVEKAMAQLHDLVTTTVPYGSSDKVPANLKPCTEMKTEQDLYAYESNVFGNFQGTVQYNMQMAGAATVADLCTSLTDATATSPLGALDAMFEKFFASADSSCIASSWDEMIGELQVEAFDGSSAMRQWIWQSCNEFGYFQTTEGDGHPFTSLTSCSLKIAGKEMCEQAYGIEGYTGPQKSGDGSKYASTEMYGSRSVLGANITMPNGNMDPWHSLGVVNATGEFYEPAELTHSETVVFIDGTAHCRDMYAPEAFASSGFNDTGAVQWAHSVISENVAAYLKE
mmetsp:Transcript_27774/g.52619  ORF Transcript_27774/g.52619 Transcript_27774/m.52619 type:complete len:541 (-) Transcript_27774:128-1750(-)